MKPADPLARAQLIASIQSDLVEQRGDINDPAAGVAAIGAERDRFRKALETIAEGDGIHTCTARSIATSALGGES